MEHKMKFWRTQEQDGQPISGQALADQLGLSRTAVWKAVELA